MHVQQCLKKSLMEGESTTDWGNEFQSLITLLLYYHKN